MASDLENRLRLKYILDDMPTKSNIKSTAGKTALQVGLGVVAGGALAAIIGKPSFLTGLAVIGAGNYMGQSWLPTVGVGMMAYSLADKPAEGSTVKDRLVNMKDEAMSKTYLDKVVSKFSKKKADEVTNGLGALEAANTLDEIERELRNSAKEYNQNNVNGYSSDDIDMSGM